jgi:hypothetical protein
MLRRAHACAFVQFVPGRPRVKCEVQMLRLKSAPRTCIGMSVCVNEIGDHLCISDTVTRVING